VPPALFGRGRAGRQSWFRQRSEVRRPSTSVSEIRRPLISRHDRAFGRLQKVDSQGFPADAKVPHSDSEFGGYIDARPFGEQVGGGDPNPGRSAKAQDEGILLSE
jgi:hypothetical protein